VPAARRSGSDPGGRADETFDRHPLIETCPVEGVPSRGGCERADRTTAQMYAFLLSTGVIFLAELGDKSQLMAMTFATRFKILHVLIGITVATAVVHLASVGLGAALGTALPTKPIAVIAGLAFLGFAAWTLRGDSLDDDEQAKAGRTTRNAIVAVAVAFFLAELGDKTMLATVTLATREGWLGTWLGSTVGMVAADALAILAGALLGRHLPERVIKYGAAAAFVIFGLLLIVQGLR
jgi:putative Ca2+/H+ antiporter (TMEM165/GDT1 family)